MKKSVLLLVDHSNVMYRAYYGSVHHMDLKPWLPYIRYFDMLRLATKRSLARYPDADSVNVIFAGESLKALKRTLIDPSYKAHRIPSKDGAFRQFRNTIPLVIYGSGWDLLTFPGAEADDVIASLAIRHAEYHRVIFSNDRDLRQLLVNENIAIYQNPGLFYTKEQFLKDYGFSPSDFICYKALIGDKSDGIKGVSGWGPSTAKKHILSKDWLEVLKPKELKQYKQALELMKLDYSISLALPKATRPAPSLYSKSIEHHFNDSSILAMEEIGLAIDRFNIETKRRNTNE